MILKRLLKIINKDKYPDFSEFCIYKELFFKLCTIYRNDPPNSFCFKAVQELSQVSQALHMDGCYIDPRKFKISDLTIIEIFDKKVKLESSMKKYEHECVECPQFRDHVSIYLITYCLLSYGGAAPFLDSSIYNNSWNVLTVNEFSYSNLYIM